MMSFKIQIEKKYLAKLISIILLSFFISYFLFLVNVNSQSEETSNYFGYSLLAFSIIVIVLAILVMTKNNIAEFLLKNYKFAIITLIIIFLVIYIIPLIPFKSITGLFVATPTTTTTTTTVVKEETLPGLTKTFSEMQSGITNNMEIFGEGVSLTELDLEVYSTLNNVKITVSRLSSKPPSTKQDPPGAVYQYLRIEKTKIKDEDLKKVTIKFRVEKSWINENGIDESTISLNRYQDNVWVGLSTTKTGEDNEFSYYETYTASLSFFAITGSSKFPDQSTTTTTTIVTTTTTTTSGITTTTIPGVTTTIPLTIDFDRSLDCNKCGQHKTPPLIDVKMTITATVSKPLQDAYFIDYYPVEWIVTNPNGGQTSAYNSSYNKIQWSVDNVEDSVTKWYSIKSPQKTSPPTNYYFFSKMENQQSDAWQVKVADPIEVTQTYDCTDPDTKCSLTTFTQTYPDGSAMTVNYQTPINFYNETSGQYENINRTIYQCVVPGHSHWTWCRDGYYTAYFRNDTTKNETEAADWLAALQIDDETWIKSTPQSIFFWNRTGQKRISQLLNETYAQFQTNNTEIYYKNAFGTGYTVGYTYDNDRLIKKFRIRGLSDIDQTLADELSGTRYFLIKEKFKFSPNLVAYIEDQGWNNISDKETNRSVVFKKDGIPLLYFPPPVAEDADGNTTNGTYYLSYSAPFLQVGIYYSYDWLLNATFPVIMDPTTATYYEKEIDYYQVNNTLNDYYFNASNAEQRTNDIQNYWSVNDFCLNLYFDSAWHEFCGDSLDWVWYNSTDFDTYTNLTGTASVGYESYSANISLEYYLKSDWSNMRITPMIKNSGNDISDLELKIHIHDINMNNTYENDTFRINLNVSDDEVSFQNYDLSNTSLSLSFDQTNLINRSSYLLDFPDSYLTNYPDKFGRIIWNESKWVNEIQSEMDYRLEVEHDSELNVPVDLILELGSLNQGDTVITNLQWIDAASTRYNKTLSRLYERPWKIEQFYDSNLSRSVELNLDKDVYTIGEDYTVCVNSSIVYEKTVNVIWYGWLRKMDEPTGIKGYFSGTRKINKFSEEICGSRISVFGPNEIVPGKYIAEVFYYVYEPNEHYFLETELFEITG